MDWPTSCTLIVAILTCGYCYGWRLWLQRDEAPSERTEAIGFPLQNCRDDDE